MADAQNGGAPRGPTAPYPAFQTLKTLCKQLKEHGVPDRIDRSVLTSFSGAVGSQVITMLKFLGLTDDASVAKDGLRNLVKAYDTQAWPVMLGEIIEQAYQPMFTINLETASPGQFNEHFRKNYPAADEVSRKSMTFFLNATKDAEIKISPYIMKNKKPRTAPSKKRTPKPVSNKPKGEKGSQTGMQYEDPPVPPSEFMKQLLEKFPIFDPSWSDPIKAEWFKGFQQFMTYTRKNDEGTK